jgi:hypothetical protein
LSGLTDGTAYTFTATATNATGTSSASSTSNSITPYSPPGAPTSVIASGGNATASISWSAPASNGGTALTTYTATAGFGNSCTATAPTTHCTISGLTNNTTYSVQVVASNSIAGSALSSAVNVTPGVPLTFGAIGTATTWTASHSAASVSYPNGTTSGDLVFLVIVGNQEPGGPAAPAGWNAGDMAAGPTGGPHTAVFWKVAAGESSVSVTPFNGGSSAAWVIRYAKGGGTPTLATGDTCGKNGIVPGVCAYGGAASSLTPTDTATTTGLATEIQIVVIPANNALSLSTPQGFTFEGTSGTAASGDAIGVADQVVGTSGTTPTAPTWSLGGTTKSAYLTTAFY